MENYHQNYDGVTLEIKDSNEEVVMYNIKMTVEEIKEANTKQKIYKIPSIGSVVIEDDVEIGANSAIDRGTIENTVIGASTKIDNLVQIGHNCKIGKACMIVSQVGIAGSSETELLSQGKRA